MTAAAAALALRRASPPAACACLGRLRPPDCSSLTKIEHAFVFVSQDLKTLLSTLLPKERYVLTQYFGVVRRRCRSLPTPQQRGFRSRRASPFGLCPTQPVAYPTCASLRSSPLPPLQGGSDPRSFKEQAKEIGVPVKVIERLARSGLEKLRHPSRAMYLLPFLDLPALGGGGGADD